MEKIDLIGRGDIAFGVREYNKMKYPGVCAHHNLLLGLSSFLSVFMFINIGFHIDYHGLKLTLELKNALECLILPTSNAPVL